MRVLFFFLLCRVGILRSTVARNIGRTRAANAHARHGFIFIPEEESCGGLAGAGGEASLSRRRRTASRRAGKLGGLAEERDGIHSANGLGWNGLKSLDCILDIFGSVAMVSTCILDWAGLGLWS